MLRLLLAVFLIGAATQAVARSDAAFSYVSSIDGQLTDGVIVIDSRPLADCRQAALPAARCLPASDFLGPHRRLPSERDILWLLGTAGLDGSEAVLVVGQDAVARDFVAGLLYLAGQRHVAVLTEPLGRILAARNDAAPGQERGITRAAVYTTPMRAEQLVLKQDLEKGIPGAVLLDGRSESEYWGETVRGARGGHLPAAVLLSATTLAPGGPRPLLPAGEAIAYAHDAYEGIAFYTRLVAGFGLTTRIYTGGWAEWAADGSLPADAASFPESRPVANAVSPAPTFGALPGLSTFAAMAALLATFAAGWALSRGRA